MPTLVFDALRPDDLLFVQFEARNLRLDVSDAADPRLVVADTSKRAYLAVHFPPQSIFERAYFETAANISNPPGPPLPGTGETPDPPGSVPRRIAGTSRLVFRLPSSLHELPFRLDALLDWSSFELMLSPTALGTSAPPPLAAPTALETALELPYRLVVAPATRKVGWVHARDPITHAGRTELWHTRLARQTASGKPRLEEASSTHTLPLRAIWSPDFVDHAPLAGTDPFRGAMSATDREQIVILTSGTQGYYVPTVGGGATPWVPEPVQASRLYLSSLGGWLASEGRWPSPPSYTADDGSTQSLDLSEWRHVATQGRDHYVKIVYDGFLYPFGHRASLVKVTERKTSAPGAVASPVSYLKQHMYVVVREREKTYGGGTYLHGGREMPFVRQVRIETLVTPDIDDPETTRAAGTQKSFWIDVGGAGFPFHVSAVDLAGDRIDFIAQLIFMDVGEPTVQPVQAAYAASGDRRACAAHGKKVTYADPAAGDTDLRTTALYFDTQRLQDGVPYPVVPYVPFLEHATVTVPALEHLLGSASPVDIALYDGYLAGGLDGHAGVFAQLEAPPTIGFTADKAGGFATPAIALTALSARKGLVAGQPSDAAAGRINPQDYFGNVSIPGKIFGTVPLSALIPTVGHFADASKNAPEIRTQLLPNKHHPQTAVTKVTWEPDLQDYSDPTGAVSLTFRQGGDSTLKLRTTIERQLTGNAPPTSEIRGELTNFLIKLLGVVDLNVVAITFHSKNGAKPFVKATLPDSHPITFDGPLAFVQALAEVLPPGIFGGSGPSIELLPQKLRVGYTLALPPVSIGVFSLEHISIGTALDLPYVDGKPAFEFSFAKRSAPFLLTVECFGGGGFVHVVVDADGVEMVEGALEFGGLFSLDLGVASGGVHVMAGIYFKLKNTSSDLTGFVDIGGEVSVLGIISVSIDLNLSLSYETSNGHDKVEGRATLTVSVHVLFFSTSVQLSVERSYGSGPGDPRVDQLMSAADWAAYAEAFA